VRISRSDNFAGVPADTARQLMRAFGRPRPESDIAHWVVDDPRTPGQIAQALADSGFLEERHYGGGDRWWETTIAGNALAQASFRRPITRETADRHLAAVIERAEQFNAISHYLVDVESIIVFGSYLDPGLDRLGDLDLTVQLRSRLSERLSSDERTARRLRYSYSSGRRFSDYVDVLFWPEDQAVRFLRNRSPAIRITRQDVSLFTDRWKVVYNYDPRSTGDT
jgi:predicted nucleotidyltransferase